MPPCGHFGYAAALAKLDEVASYTVMYWIVIQNMWSVDHTL